jgi:hypothetical protein
LAEIRLPSPAYAPGSEPSAADACGQVLQLIEFSIRQIETLVGGVGR